MKLRTVPLLIFALVFVLNRLAISQAQAFDITQCPLERGQRVFIYQNEQTFEVLGCIRIDVRTCEVNLRKGDWSTEFEQKYVDSCRKAKEIAT